MNLDSREETHRRLLYLLCHSFIHPKLNPEVSVETWIVLEALHSGSATSLTWQLMVSGFCCTVIAPDYFHHINSHLDDLPLFERKLFICCIRVWGHGWRIIIKESHKDPEGLLRLWLIVVCRRAAITVPVAILKTFETNKIHQSVLLNKECKEEDPNKTGALFLCWTINICKLGLQFPFISCKIFTLFCAYSAL